MLLSTSCPVPVCSPGSESIDLLFLCWKYWCLFFLNWFYFIFLFFIRMGAIEISLSLPRARRGEPGVVSHIFIHGVHWLSVSLSRQYHESLSVTEAGPFPHHGLNDLGSLLRELLPYRLSQNAPCSVCCLQRIPSVSRRVWAPGFGSGFG